MTTQQTETQPDQSSQRPPRSLAEWVTFGIASLILGAIAALVVYTWTTEKDQPPVLVVETGQELRQAEGIFYVPFQLTNRGGETATSVQVIAELRRGDQIEAIGEQQVDFLARNERVDGAFLLRQPPRPGELVIRVGSYQLP